MGRRIRTLEILAAGAAGYAGWRALRDRRAIDLRGRVVMITGGSRWLGLLLAREFAAQGTRLSICARDEAELARAHRDLESRGADVLSVRCDVSRPEEIAGWVDRALPGDDPGGSRNVRGMHLASAAAPSAATALMNRAARRNNEYGGTPSPSPRHAEGAAPRSANPGAGRGEPLPLPPARAGAVAQRDGPCITLGRRQPGRCSQAGSRGSVAPVRSRAFVERNS